MIILPFKTVDILAECDSYISVIKEDAKKRRPELVGFLDPRTYSLSEKALRRVFPFLKKEGVVSETATFKGKARMLENDMRVYAATFEFLNLSAGDARKNDMQQKTQGHVSDFIGVRGMMQEGVLSWDDFEAKWEQLGEEVRKQRAFVASPEFGQTMNYLNLCPSWKEKSQETRDFYDALCSILGFNYLMRGTMSAAATLTRIKEKGFSLTKAMLTRYSQILSYGYRYLITTDPEERKKILKDSQNPDNNLMVAVHVLQASGIHTWEELMAQRTSYLDSKKEDIISFSPQAKNVALPADEFVELESTLDLFGKTIPPLIREVRAHREENARLLEEVRNNNQILEDMRKELEAVLRENRELKEEVNEIRKDHLRRVVEANPHIKELWIGREKLEEEQRARVNRKKQLAVELPREKTVNENTSLKVIYHSAFEDDYVDLPKSIQDATLEAIKKILTPEFDIGFYLASLQTKSIEGRLKGDSVTPQGSSESRVTLKYRITHGYEKKDTGTKVLVFYRVISHP